MNVFEFIKEKKSGIKDNTEQYRAILEPKFRSWSNKINNKIINTLNNPWMVQIFLLKRTIFQMR